ncbi:MAG: hypothetical protein SGARI_007818 [Bacillariaceae sp.]
MKNYDVKRDSLPALRRLILWTGKKDASPKEMEGFFKAFVTLGAIPRVLDFLKLHMSDNLSVILAVKVIALCPTHALRITSTEEYCVKQAVQIVEYNGIETLIAVSRNWVTEDENPLFQVYKSLHTLVKIEESRALMGRDQQMKILDAAMTCLGNLKEENIKAETVVFKIMKTLEKLVLDGSFLSHHVNDLRESGFVSLLVGSMKRKTELDKSFWIGDEQCFGTAFNIIFRCTMHVKKSIITGSDLEGFIPFCIHALKTFPDSDQVRGQSMRLLNYSVKSTNKKKMEASVLEAIADLLKTDRITAEAKDEARKIVATMYN